MAKATKRKVSRARGNNLKKTVRRGRKLNRAVNHVKATKKRRKSRSRRTSRKVRNNLNLNQSGGVGFFREYMTASQIEDHLNGMITGESTFIQKLNSNPQKPEGIILKLEKGSEENSIKITGGNINLEIKITSGIRFRDKCKESKTYFLNIINEDDVETSKYYSVENLVSGIGSILSTIRHTSGALPSRLSVRMAEDLALSSAKPVEPVSPLTIVYESIVTIPIYMGLERTHELVTSLGVNKFILRINNNRLVISYKLTDGSIRNEIISKDSTGKDLKIPSEDPSKDASEYTDFLTKVKEKLPDKFSYILSKNNIKLSLPEQFILQIVKKPENLEALYAPVLANRKDPKDTKDTKVQDSPDELAWKKLILNLESNPFYNGKCTIDGPLPSLPQPPTPPPRGPQGVYEVPVNVSKGF